MDKDYESLRDGADVFIMSNKIVRQSWDKWKVGKKLGDQCDLIQQVCETLLSVKSGGIIYDHARGVSFYGFVMDRMRWLAQENWMLEAPRGKRPEQAQPPQIKDDADANTAEDDEVDKVADARLHTVTPRCQGLDEQSDDIDDDIGENNDDQRNDCDCDADDDDKTPAHKLLLHAGSSELARLLGCANRTIINLRMRAKDSRRVSK